MIDKEFFIDIDGENIPVSEAVYHAFKRPVWTERKRSQVRTDHERSLEQFLHILRGIMSMRWEVK